MTSTKKIKWGILGLGKIAHAFAEDLDKVTDAELHAVASRSVEKADVFGHEFGVAKRYNSYEELAKDPEIDAIYIATPHSSHKENSILCLQHKKAVLCEKPFAMNHHEVAEMIQKAKENDVLLMEALWTRFLPHYQYVINLVTSEAFGKLKTLHADFGFYRKFDSESRLFKKEVGGGSLLDIGIYPIFAALSTLGVPKVIDAKASFFENGADADCFMTFHYDESIAYLKSSLIEPLSNEAIFAFEKAIVTIHKPFHGPTSITILKDGKPETLDFNYHTLGYSFEIEHFNNLLFNNRKESDLMTFEFSKDLIRTLDSVRKIIGLEY